MVLNASPPKIRLSGDCDLGRHLFVLPKITLCAVAFHQFILRLLLKLILSLPSQF